MFWLRKGVSGRVLGTIGGLGTLNTSRKAFWESSSRPHEGKRVGEYLLAAAGLALRVEAAGEEFLVDSAAVIFLANIKTRGIILPASAIKPATTPTITS